MAHVPRVLDQMRICAIIPVYNEAERIGRLVTDLKRQNFDVVVIDDGSNDNSGWIAKEKGAVVITHQKKSGKGLSLRDGFDYAVRQNYHGVITIDGDGQHDVDDIPRFVEKAKDGPNCVITGSRMENPRGMPFIRLIVNKLMSVLISFVCKQRIPDTQCGFRFIGGEVLKSIHLSSSDFEIESEVLIKASKKGFKIYSVPIKTIYSNECSKINPLTDTVRFFVYIFREAWNSKP